MSNTNHRVVITGIGMLTPLGLDTASTWQGLISGKSGINCITQFDVSRHDTKIAGEIKGFDPTAFMSVKEAKRMDRFAQLAVAAAKQALVQSGLVVDASNADSIGTIIGSGIGGLNTLFEQAKILIEKGPDRLSPFTVPMMISDMAAGQVSISLGLKGTNFCTTSACSSGADAIGVAFEFIRRGDMPVIFTGGSESCINPIGVGSFSALKALSTRNDSPETASRPFDATRDGFIISEGSAVLVLESLEHARARGAHIIGEMLSYGASADAYHMTQPTESGEGGVRSMKRAIERAGLKPEDIDYVNAHGTSTQLNDKMETCAIKSVFGQNAGKVPVSSTKSMTGHLIGAAGALEASICALVIKEGIIPPTINLTHPDPNCDLDYVPNKARKAKVKIALSNSFGFGGHNSTLILGRYSEAGV
ncbi:MAG: beta-ketoacyl-[acyl-carrier-protein] synthase II [Dehalococcoidia bacterium]|nr:MAG: beta-ketoacyl-[acyl-carrier-protein] synthase II [Dehalococcoidia bacterium]